MKIPNPAERTCMLTTCTLGPDGALSRILTDIMVVKLGTWFHLSRRCGSLKIAFRGPCHISSANFPLAGVQKGGSAAQSELVVPALPLAACFQHLQAQAALEADKMVTLNLSFIPDGV